MYVCECVRAHCECLADHCSLFVLTGILLHVLVSTTALACMCVDACVRFCVHFLIQGLMLKVNYKVTLLIQTLIIFNAHKDKNERNCVQVCHENKVIQDTRCGLRHCSHTKWEAFHVVVHR